MTRMPDAFPHHVSAVEVVRGFLGEVGDAALTELVVEGAGIVGDEDKSTERAFGDQLAKLIARGHGYDLTVQMISLS